MHDDLWSGVDLKSQYASFFLQEMSSSLQPPEQTANNVVLESAGAIVGNLWQQSFYPNFDAFLAMARSIPEIILSCFGDPTLEAAPKKVRKWFNALPPAEKKRREAFSLEFKSESYKAFRDHGLSNERNISFHRTGYASVEVVIKGRFGVDHIGSPVIGVAISESRPGDPVLPLPQRSLPVRPMWTDFTIDGKPLFDECQAYLTLAQQLVDQARTISLRIHGKDSLTRQPAL